MDINQPPRRRTDIAAKPKIHPNLAFRRAAIILLTPECLLQIEDLAEHLSGQTKESS